MRGAIFALSALALAACSQDEPKGEPPVPKATPAATKSAAPKDGAKAKDGDKKSEDAAAEAKLGTPLEDRVATLGLLNKRNNLSQEIELKPGESKRFDNVVVRLSSCERTAPWEMPQETGAFVQVLVLEAGAEDWKWVFSGWLFKNSPSVNVVEHPIYDVWIKDCAMRFPGDDEPVRSSSSDEGVEKAE